MDENSKYYALFEHLLFSGQGRVRMSFANIERVMGKPLPPTARKRAEWWSNNLSGHSQAQAWHRAGYRTQLVNLAGETVDFALEGWPERFQSSSRIPGFSEAEQAPYGAADNVREGENVHPLVGIWKGKVTLLPDYDYSQPIDSDWAKVHDD